MKNGEHKGVMVEQHMNVLNDTELYIFKNGQMINLRLYIFYYNKKKNSIHILLYPQTNGTLCNYWLKSVSNNNNSSITVN